VRVRVVCAGLVAALVVMVTPALAGAATAKLQKYHVQLLHINVKTGPGKKTTCNIVGQLYRPDSATKQHRAPAILTTNGFGGSYKSQADPARELAENGYVVLAYSGLGFGGSSCRITLDSTTWDGEAASQLVSFLGGGLKATNGTRVNYVEQQKRALNGKRYRYDPVVGMIGGSYGGAVQFAAAAEDPRIDAIIPMITWNNLAYSLAPNNSSISGSSVSSTLPGVTKLSWLNIFWLAGTVATKPVAPNGGASSCPNFAGDICKAYDDLTTDGYPDSTTEALVRDASVADYMHRVKAPTLLMQGEFDTLFTLHEAVATYDSMRAQHTPVKMVWQSWGHSHGTAQPGELGAGGGIYQTTSDHKLTLEGRMALGWFNYYLRHQGAKPALNFSYYKPWVHYSGDDAARAYSSASRYPIGRATKYYLSGSDALTTSRSSAETGTNVFTIPAAGDTESISDNPFATAEGEPVAISDPAGTYANYESAPLKKALNVVGIPTVTITAKAPAGELADTPGLAENTLGLYVKLEDISAGGTATLPDHLIAAVRIPDNGKPAKVYLPGIVHQFKKGDKLDLIVAGSDSSYSLADPGATVTVATSAGDPGALSLPVVGSSSPVKLTAK
jgi:pimeloyl-ACP methyl ester carboxylesterase